MKTKAKLFLIVSVFVLTGCQSRLAQNIYEIRFESKVPLKTERSYYLSNAILKDRPDSEPIAAGKGNILVAHLKAPEPKRDEYNLGFMKAVAEIEYRIFAEIPSPIMAESLNIADKSICRLIGLFDLNDNLKRYYCRDGYLLIDSVKSSKFYARIHGAYYNFQNDSLVIDGNLVVKKKKR
jgi:hypothetical protein